MRHISANGLKLIKEFEGFRASVYRDSVGVPTQGYGETQGVTPGRPWSESYASSRLKTRIRRDYEPYIHRLGIALNQNQFDALVSFVYNLGPLYLQSGHSMGDALRRRDWRAAADAFMLYDRAGNQVLPGLKRRRETERALFLKAAPRPVSRNDQLIAQWQKRLAQIRLVVKKLGHWTPKRKAEAKALKRDIRNHGGKA